MNGIHARFMVSRSQRWRSEYKTMPVVLGPLFLVHVRPILVSDGICGKAIVDE
jgi:hypothetical protein